MSSANTLKHNITVNHSLYGAIFVFSLYVALIILALLLLGISWLTSPLVIVLLIIAVYGGRKQYSQRYQLQLSDSGLLEVVSKAGSLTSAKITTSSFYNVFFLSLHLQHNTADQQSFVDRKKITSSYLVIYRDAVSEKQYRFLARLINSRRD